MKLETEDIPEPEAKKIEPPPRHRTRMKKAAPPPPSEPAPRPPLSNGVVLRRSVSAEPRAPQPPKPARNSLHLARPTPGEDCAIDEMLEGRMELTVVLPDLKKVRMTVDRRTPMMDILVQAATSNKICPSEHIIQLAGRDAPLHTPSAPVGALDARTLHIVPKAALDLPVRRMPKLPNQPFEQQTFRLQVNLPQNQRMVVRVSPRTTLAEIKQQVCAARELDLRAHHLVHPAQPDTVLDLEATLEVYGCAEITLISSAGLRDSIRNTATYFTQPPRLEEEKRKKGILRLFSRRKRDFTTETPANGVNHLSSSQSDGSTLNRNSYQTKQSTKRKPAPAPPPNQNPSPPLITQSSNSLNSRPESEISVKTVDDIESSVSHSRHSSDSSGYHEPSVFSDCSENKSPEASVVHGDPGYVSDVHRQDSPLQRDHLAENTLLMKRASRDSSNLQSVPSCSNVSISSASRKRKAPQPPVATLPAIESPSSPDAPPVAEPSGNGRTAVAAKDAPSKQDAAVETVREATDCEQQESEALQYLEDVLQESSKELPCPPMLDDSDTDSLRDECQVISVCQAEVHATASDHESPDSLVESQTVVASAPESQTDTSTSLPNPTSLPAGSEEPTVLEIVPSEQELPADNCRETVNIVEDLESPACEVAHLETTGVESSLETGQLLEDLPSTSAREQNASSSCMTAATVQDTSEQQPADKEASKTDKASSEGSSANSVHSGSRQSSTTVTPQLRKKLDNFVLTSFKKDGIEDIFSSPTNSNTNSCLVKNSKVEVPKQIPDVERISTKRAVDVPVSSRETYVQPSKTNTLPLGGRCSSMYNLTPQKGMKIFSSEKSEVTESDEGMKRTQSVQDVSDVDVKANLMQEQRRLQEEYQRLQQQFISWQKQLMNNQSLLQSENILPSLPFASPAGLDSLENAKKTHSENQLSAKEESSHREEYKTRSLPRPKSTSFSLRQFRELPRPKTPPMPSSPSEASVVNISIDSAGAKRPDTLASCSVNTQADVKIEDKVTQVPSPQDKTVQVPSPQEKVTSGVQVPSPPEAMKSKENVSAQTSLQNLASPTESTSSESEGSKSQTLPRPKPKPISAFQPSQTMTLNRKSMPRPAVAVTIGSWQQRQSTAAADIEPSNVASSRSKFQSLENIPQSSTKPIPAYMEKRKLPPVPTEETSVKEVHSKKLTEQPSEKKGSNVARESKKPSVKSSDSTVVKEQNAHETLVKTVASSSKAHHSEGAVPKHKTELKQVAKEQTIFKSVKPFIKMSSMKDESHSPTIVGLRKWPLSDINENKALGEDRPTVIEDLKASSRRPGGFFVQEKIRRAEVDLRKPKSSKTEPSSAAKMKKAEVEPDNPKPSGTQTTPKCEDSEPCVKPSKLHITKVSITSRNSDQPPKQEKRFSSNVTTPVCAPSSANTNTIPKSHSLNSELLAAFSKKSEKDSERYKEVGGGAMKQSIKLNGSVQPPPPPPPPPVQSTSSVMPPIPPAEQIPVSSQLVMAKGPSNATVTKKESKKGLTSFTRTSDPREELMLEIRGFGGKQALKKIQTVQPGWNLKVYGTTTTTNS